MLEEKKQVNEMENEVTIQEHNVRLDGEEENQGIGFEIVIGSTER